jgi:hypothetical protein
MPKTPILYREIFYSEIRGTKEPTTGQPQLQPLPWNHVETELGFMMEPRADPLGPDASGKMVQIDMNDAAASKISIIDSGVFYSQWGTDGGVCTDFNA